MLPEAKEVFCEKRTDSGQPEFGRDLAVQIQVSSVYFDLIY